MDNVRIYACSTVMEMFGIKDKSELADFVDDVIGVASERRRGDVVHLGINKA